MKKQVIAYLHTHWDREWYREFEIFRLRLLRVFDEVIYALENDLIPSFYFDGQVAALLDYLKMRPEREKNIRTLIKKKKLFIGPFYCLIDEFLTNENLFRKNLKYGLKIAREFGCEDFTGYLPDTFGHSDGVIKLLKEFGLQECLVWRGCGDLPSEFIWQAQTGETINAINLIRGYFMDIFTTRLSVKEKADFLKNNLDKIARKSSGVLLLPIGADHLGIPVDIKEQIQTVNSLLDNYEIKLGSVFDYIKAVKDNYKSKHTGELRDNSLTFTLEGSYSSRADIKRMNIIAEYELERAEKLVNFYNLHDKYETVLEYGYTLLLKNQAHDSICGCSTDDTHYENILRYKKIEQICKEIISEIKFDKQLNNKIINLGATEYSGVVERIKYKKNKNDIVLGINKGFPEDLLTDIKRIPVTEDYQNIYKTLEYIREAGSGETDFKPAVPDITVEADDTVLKGKVTVEVQDYIKFCAGKKCINIFLKDFKDYGDSYNRGPVKGDSGRILKIKSSRLKFKSSLRSVLEIKFENSIKLELALNADSDYPKFHFIINNKKKNHHLFMCLEFDKPVTETLSEDMNRFIKRAFNPEYEIREHLPEKRGIEAKTNTAPCQRLVSANDFGAVLCGVTQYEVFKNELRLSLIRSTGVISNPENSSRSTPAGPPIETPDLQLLKTIEQEVWLYYNKTPEEAINRIFNFLYV